MAAASGSAESLNVEASEDEISLPSDPESGATWPVAVVTVTVACQVSAGAASTSAWRRSKRTKGLRSEIQMAFQGETKLRVSELKFKLMKQFLDCEHDSHRRFNIFGFAACRNALASVLIMSKNKVRTVSQWLAAGHKHPPLDLRFNCDPTLLSTFYNVGLVHEFLAEPLAEANIPVLQLDIGVKAKALLAPSQMGSPELPSETRHLRPGTALSELLQVAKSFLGPELQNLGAGVPQGL